MPGKVRRTWICLSPARALILFASGRKRPARPGFTTSLRRIRISGCRPARKSIISTNAGTARSRRGGAQQDERDLRFREKLQWLGTQSWLDLTNYGQLFVAKGSLLSGDITPAYCMLPDEIIAMVIRQFPEAKVIFLARDPVERAWSQISMSVRKGGRAPFDVNDPAEVVRQLLHPLVVQRSHPSMIVARWRRHVAPGQFGLFFFDDLKNQPAELRRSIIAFLGGDPDKATNRLRPEDNRNPGKKPPLSEEVQVHLAKFFARELRACAAELGGRATEWPSRYGL